MKFDIWTFLFQIINFVVLLFILKRLLYRPVREILERRREQIQKTVEEAERTREEALELKARHEKELRELDDVKSRMLDRMHGEVLEERKRLLAEAEREGEAQIERERTLFETEKRGFEGVMKEKVLETVALFSSRLLRDIADEELHRALWRRLLGGIEAISREISERGMKEGVVGIEVVSAYPIREEDILELKRGLEGLLSREVAITPALDGTLIAGVKLRTEDMVYDSSLSGQIKEFGARLKAY
jgi:F-type H+-transporting ATPase subunit b